jgi:hypothetical protein
MILAAFAWSISLVTGWALLEMLWPSRDAGARPRNVIDAILRFGLALGLGLLVSSLGYFVLMSFGVLSRASLIGFDILFAIATLAAAFATRGDRTSIAADDDEGVGFASLVLIVGLTAAILLVGAFAFRSHQATPLGAWDAFAIWNLKARFFFEPDADSWRAVFSPIIAWSHTDYPLLVSLGVARIWTWAGQESLALSAIQSVLFALLSACVVFGAVARLRGLVSGCLALGMLISSEAALRAGIDQLADVPVGFYFVASLAVLAIAREEGDITSRWPVLVGLLAGAAAWTKNEGLLMAIAIAAAVLVLRGNDERASRLQRGLSLAIGLALPLACVVYLKLGLGGESDLLAGQSRDTLAGLVDPKRHAAILLSFGSSALALAGLPLLAIAGLLIFTLRQAPRPQSWRAAQCVGLALAIHSAGLYIIYLTTPRDLDWHLASSNLRLFIQLWPSLVLLFFLILGKSGQLITTQEPTKSQSPRSRE